MQGARNTTELTILPFVELASPHDRAEASTAEGVCRVIEFGLVVQLDSSA